MVKKALQIPGWVRRSDGAFVMWAAEFLEGQQGYHELAYGKKVDDGVFQPSPEGWEATVDGIRYVLLKDITAFRKVYRSRTGENPTGRSNMKVFNTKDIIELGKGIDPGIRTEIGEVGGSYDTVCVLFSIPFENDSIRVLGFDPDRSLDDKERDNVMVAMLELRNLDSDSTGGEELAVFAAKLRTRLVKAGWDVVPNLDNYF